MRHIVGAIALLGLAGCATYYRAPDGVPTAVLEFSTELSPVIVYLFEDAECKPSRKGHRLAFISSMSGTGGKHRGPVSVEAGRELVFTMHKSNPGGLGPLLGGYSCDVTVRFVPKAEYRYQARFINTKSAMSSGWTNPECQVQLFVDDGVSRGDRRFVADDSLVRNDKTCRSVQ